MPPNETSYPVCDFDPFLIQFSESVGVRWYGLAYVAGFIVAGLLLRLYYKCGRSPYNPDQQMTLMTAIVIGTLVGGRLGYILLYRPESLLENPLNLFKVWEGGMASHGGFVGICIAIWWFAHHTKRSFFYVADIVVTLGPAGVLFGRVANFINGELWGKVTDVSWAWIFPKSAEPGTPVWMIPPRHPSQLYEAFFEGLLLLVYLQLRFWLSDPKKRPAGLLAAEFLMLYAIGRIFSEFFREPDGGSITLIMGLSRGTFYSIITFLAGLAMLVYALKRKKQPAA